MYLLYFSEENTLLCTHKVKHVELHKNKQTLEMRTLSSKAIIPVRLYIILANLCHKKTSLH